MTRLYVGSGIIKVVVAFSLISISSLGCGKKPLADLNGYGVNITTATVTGVSPTAGLMAGNTEITITGSGFVEGAEVTVGGSSCAPVVFISSTEIKCTTSSHGAGTGEVVVTNPGASPSAAGSFTFRPDATVSSVSPSSGAVTGGTVVTITGTALSPDAVITIGGQPCTGVSVNASQTELTCTTTGGGSGSADLAVQNPGAPVTTVSDGFTFKPAPTIASISASSGGTIGGHSIVIDGTNFDSASVLLGASSCSVTAQSATQITCTTPVHAPGTVDLKVTNSDGQFAARTGVDGYTFKTFAIIGNSGNLKAAASSILDTGALATSTAADLGGAAGAVAIHPTQAIAYIAYPGSIVHLSMNPSNGALSSALTNVAGPLSPSSLVIHPSGSFAYASHSNGASVTSVIKRYSIAASGQLTFESNTNAQTGNLSLTSLAIDPSGKFAYAVYNGSSKIEAYSINSGNGALSFIATYNTGSNPRGLAIDASGKYVYVANFGSAFVSGFTIDATTGALNAHGATYDLPGGATSSTGIATSGSYVFTSNGTDKISAFVMNADDGTLDAGTGYNLAGGSNPVSVAVDPSGQYLYVLSMDSNEVIAYGIGGGGALTPIGGGYTADISAPVGMAFTSY